MIQTLGTISRLKGFFRSGINYPHYEKMLKLAERKASGSLPNDIISCLISNNKDKSTAIKATEKIFCDTVNILGEINILEKQAINRMSQSQDTQARIFNFIERGDIKRLFRLDSIYKEKEIETIIRAEEKMLSEIKKYIPETQNIVITPLGSGIFGNGYRLQVLGRNGQPIFGDKAIKVYRESFLGKIFEERNKRFADYMPDEKLIEQYRKVYESLGMPVPNISASEIRKKTLENYKVHEKRDTALKIQHGAMAEANISEFLKFFSGHKVTSKDGIAIPSFFGLDKTKFSLGEFICKKTKAERKFDFERLFLKHEDFEYGLDNGINGICIDMGGIVSLLGEQKGQEIFSSKNNMHIIKSFFRSPKNKREALLNEYRKNGTFSEKLLSELEKLIMPE